jgi:apolipoprotein N-acyltransferase
MHLETPRQRWFDRTRFIAAGLGALTVAGFAPLYWYPLPILTLAAVMWLWSRASTPRQTFALGWWFGLGFFLTGVSWVYVSLSTFGGMPAALAAFFTLLFCAFLALFPAVTGYCFAVVRSPLWMKLLIVAPAAWTLSEWIRGWIFTGFPWLAIGYSQVPMSALAGHAPVFGVFGVSLVTALSAGVLVLLVESARAVRPSAADAAHGRQWSRVLPSLAVLVLVWGSGYALRQVQWTEPTGKPVTVTLLQGNIAQDIKWTPEGLHTTLLRYEELALASKSQLIVLPETAIPLFLHDVPADYLARIAEHARHNGGDALIGVPERLGSGDYYNSLISVGSSPTQVYRKSHLVPFGEFIPLRPVLGWIVSVLAIPLQDFSRGSELQKPLAVGGQRVAVNICYEDAFGEEIIRQLPAATVLANVSNVAWFGRSIAPYQHLQISQARALETGRYMIRATNTGMTGVIDEQGRVLHLAREFETAALTAAVQGYTGATPYVRLGNGPVIGLCMSLLLGSLLYARLRRAA